MALSILEKNVRRRGSAARGERIVNHLESTLAHTSTSSPPRAAQLALDSTSVTPIESAVEKFLGTLRGADIPVVAIAGSRFAPVLRDPLGLQLMCLPRHLDRVTRFMQHALEAEGVSVVWSSRDRGVAIFQLYAFCGTDRHHHLRLEVSTCRQWRGITYLDAHEVFRNRDVSRSPHRPAAVIGTLAHFLPGYLTSGHIERESTTRLVVTADTHPVQLRAVLGKMVGTGAAERFVEALRREELSSLVKEAPRFRRALVRHSLIRRPLQTLSALASRLMGEEREDPGFLVAVVGPKGAETQALATEMRTELRAPFHASTCTSLQPVEDSWSCGDEDAEPAAGHLASWWQAARNVLAFRRAYGSSVEPALRGGGAVVVDGWIDEWALEPERFGLKSSNALVRWMAASVRQPDVILVCSPTSTELMQRRPELSRREALALTAAYEAFAASHPTAFAVPCEGDDEPAVGLAMAATLAGMEALTPGAALLTLSGRDRSGDRSTDRAA